jgi:hypothetical protein
LRIEGPVTITGSSALAKCYWCKQQVVIPVRLDVEALEKAYAAARPIVIE